MHHTSVCYTCFVQTDLRKGGIYTAGMRADYGTREEGSRVEGVVVIQCTLGLTAKMDGCMYIIVNTPPTESLIPIVRPLSLCERIGA